MRVIGLAGWSGAGKTTLISIVCGIVTASAGTVTVAGHDHARDYRAARTLIGLVPQELHTDAFETVLATVSFSRGLFGKPRDPGFIEQLLRDLSLWDKRHSKIMELSGGMKRRVMIAKALSHEPDILFLDEPTAGVDVELRRDMWQMVHGLRERGVTIILTTHYIEEAEEMADRVGVISKGRLILVEEKHALIKKLGRKTLTLNLAEPLVTVPAELADWKLALTGDGHELVYEFDSQAEATGVPSLLRRKKLPLLRTGGTGGARGLQSAVSASRALCAPASAAKPFLLKLLLTSLSFRLNAFLIFLDMDFSCYTPRS